MKDYTGIDLSALPDCRRVMKKDIPVAVRFAKEHGTLRTLEGDVPYEPGDAILTGVKNESWPVRREEFFHTYEPRSSVLMGQNGLYSKRPLAIWAVQLSGDSTVRIRAGNVQLHGASGDWLLQYSPGEYGIVKADIFDQTYEKVE